jgi:hypothetical protein
VFLSSDLYTGIVPFTANLTVSVTNGTAPFTLSLCTSAGQCRTTRGWSGSAPIVEPFNVTAAGTYEVSALVTDAEDLSGSATLSIVGRNPAALNATPMIGPTSGTVPLLTTFRAIVTGGTGPYVVQWTFGDGNTTPGSPGVAITHLYDQPGTYYPTLVITDSDRRTINVSLPAVDVLVPRSTSPPGGATPAYEQFLVPGAIVLLGLAAAAVIYVVRRRRVENDAEATLREVTGKPGPGEPPEDPGREDG